ncbi:MAG: dTMP kinase [Promicromonosporaceae bacterium]|nr:dTMP kinase [Promicromonosporaceae bacterium]
MSKAGFFLTFEGGDGAGKSTQALALADHLRERFGVEVLITFEPGDTNLGRDLRRLIQHGEDMDPRTEALLYAADRAHHVATVIRPALNRGAIVISDRYLDSSVAYQAAGRELAASEIERLSLWATEGLLPDVTVLLDVDETEALERQHGELDRIEAAGAEFRARGRAGFLTRAAADPKRWRVIDGGGSVADVQREVVAVVEPLISAWLTDDDHPIAGVDPR